MALYAAELSLRGDLDAFLGPLRGWDLACYCPPGEPCHAEVLLDAVAGLNPGTFPPAVTPGTP